MKMLWYIIKIIGFGLSLWWSDTPQYTIFRDSWLLHVHRTIYGCNRRQMMAKHNFNWNILSSGFPLFFKLWDIQGVQFVEFCNLFLSSSWFPLHAKEAEPELPRGVSFLGPTFIGFKTVLHTKLDGVGLVDNRPSTN